MLLIKKIVGGLLVLVPLISVASEKIIRIDGSSTVFPISEAVAEDFQKSQKIKVTVGESGTGGGFKKFCRGETEITNASRPIKQSEIDACKSAGIQFIELPIAYDALTVVVHKKNTWIQTISIDDLKKIWVTGSQIKTWNQLNPKYPNKPLQLFGPGTASGTFDYFTEAIIGKAGASRSDYSPSEDDNVLVQGAASNEGSLAYFGYAYFDQNKDRLSALGIVPKTGGSAVYPSIETVLNGSYQPLSRPLFIYVNAINLITKPEVKTFVDFYLQHVATLSKEVGYIPLTSGDYAAVQEHFKKLKAGTGFNGKVEVGIKIQDLLERIKN